MKVLTIKYGSYKWRLKRIPKIAKLCQDTVRWCTEIEKLRFHESYGTVYLMQKCSKSYIKWENQ